MKPCPYRAHHEFGDDGLCIHCFAKRELTCVKHRFRFGGRVVNALGTCCVWCGKPLGEAMDDERAASGPRDGAA